MAASIAGWIGIVLLIVISLALVGAMVMLSQRLRSAPKVIELDPDHQLESHEALEPQTVD